MEHFNSEVEEYIAKFSAETQKALKQLRKAIRKPAPAAKEAINYGIPTFILHGNLVHYGGYKNHIGFYPAPSAIKAFETELSPFKGAKGSIKFPLGQPMPLDLIKQIVEFRVQENAEKAEAKSEKKKA